MSFYTLFILYGCFGRGFLLKCRVTAIFFCNYGVIGFAISKAYDPIEELERARPKKSISAANSFWIQDRQRQTNRKNHAR
ncbi:hypothetical protein EJ08DRAFT_97934 [Tothia fuscella]|uniref:Uncharacterized protein n=1 Tax=Tothia fuscella TaxID=1048955 RepID=A0A9P4NEG5_9PEZI|nr:hypothetical protein EJ08DRAFT_97934 [Tothia fuscella]